MKRIIISLLVFILLSFCSQAPVLVTQTSIPLSTASQINIPIVTPTSLPTLTATPVVNPDQRVALGPLLESPNDLTVFGTQIEFKPGMEKVAYDEICLPAYYMMDNAYRAWKGDTPRTFDEFKNSIPADGMVPAYTFGQHSTEKEMGSGEVELVGNNIDIRKCIIELTEPGSARLNRPEDGTGMVQVAAGWLKVVVEDNVMKLKIATRFRDNTIFPERENPYMNDNMEPQEISKQSSVLFEIFRIILSKVTSIPKEGWGINGSLIVLNASGEINDPPIVVLDRKSVYGSELVGPTDEWFNLEK